MMDKNLLFLGGGEEGYMPGLAVRRQSLAVDRRPPALGVWRDAWPTTGAVV